MKHKILGLHHITATVNDAQKDLDFYVDLLGLRLVKKTVNFDNHNVYHFYYGTETGAPGTIMTTFPYQGWGVPEGRKGTGQATSTAFSVPASSLGFWRGRLAALNPVQSERMGEWVLCVEDPSGLHIELIGTEADTRPAWETETIERAAAIRGIHSVSLSLAQLAPTQSFMQGLLGYAEISLEGPRLRMGLHGGGPGKQIDLLHEPHRPRGRNGIGTVHHVAMGIATDEEQEALRAHIESLGVGISPVMDRSYFHSIYFREPGGVLFEVATSSPGFLIDESVGELGQGLKLPPWEEPNRAKIEAGLDEIRY